MAKIAAITNSNSKCEKILKTKNIKIVEDNSIDRIESLAEQGYEFYVYDNVAKYYQLGSLGYKVKYIPLFSIDVYANAEDFETELDEIEAFALENNISCNFYTDVTPLAIIMRAKKPTSSKFIFVFTKEPELFANLDSALPNKRVYVNVCNINGKMFDTI